MIEAALRLEHSTTHYVDSDVFAKFGKWPGLMIAKGTWDYVEGLEGSLDAYRRPREPREIFVFRGPHSLATQNPENMRLVGAHGGLRGGSRVGPPVRNGRPRAGGSAEPRRLQPGLLGTHDGPCWCSEQLNGDGHAVQAVAAGVKPFGPASAATG